MDSRSTGILSYIKKSKLVESLTHFDAIAHQAELDELQRAITSGDATAAIFSHPDCQLFLTHLAAASEIEGKENKITSDVFLQTSLYLAFLQFQKRKRGYGFVLSHPGAAKEYLGYDIQYDILLKGYLEEVKKYFPSLNIQEAYAVYKQLNGVDQFLMVQDVPRWWDDKLGAVLSSVGPSFFVIGVLISPEESLIVIPSVGFLKWLGLHLNPGNQIGMAPIYGAVGMHTLYNDFHRYQLRPISIFSNDVKSSLTKVHGVEATPLVIMLHDIHYHYMVLSLLPHNIMQFLIKMTGLLIKRRDEAANPKAKTFFARMFEEWSDFELSSFVAVPVDPNNYRRVFAYAPLSSSYNAIVKLSIYVLSCIRHGLIAAGSTLSTELSNELEIFFSDMLKIEEKLPFDLNELLLEIREGFARFMPELSPASSSTLFGATQGGQQPRASIEPAAFKY